MWCFAGWCTQVTGTEGPSVTVRRAASILEVSANDGRVLAIQGWPHCWRLCSGGRAAARGVHSALHSPRLQLARCSWLQASLVNRLEGGLPFRTAGAWSGTVRCSEVWVGIGMALIAIYLWRDGPRFAASGA